jgi:HPr kinase/phosphorylase
VFLSKQITTVLAHELTIYQEELLAPTLISHGVLVEVFGVGVLITGKAGIGKSETALDLITRGHRLVADDTVVIKNIGENLYVKY